MLEECKEDIDDETYQKLFREAYEEHAKQIETIEQEKQVSWLLRLADWKERDISTVD